MTNLTHKWLSIRQVRKELADPHTARSHTQCDIYHMLYWYNWFSWWWAWGCSKHVENWNKCIRKELCIKLFISQKYTEIHGQQNIKFLKFIECHSICAVLIAIYCDAHKDSNHILSKECVLMGATDRVHVGLCDISHDLGPTHICK
jgi:hypothetical protein